MNKKLLPITFSILFIVSCGGGGGGGSTPTPPTTPAPTVNLSAEPTSVLLESTSTLTWSSTNATSCSASWTTQTGTSGSEAVTISTVGNNSFSISCTGEGGTRSASVNVEGYRETDGVVVDGYISGAEVCIDEDKSWTCDASENSTTSDNEGKFTIRYANGNLVSIGGTDLDSQTLLDNLLITHKLTGHSDFKAVTPVTSVAAFMEDASLVNAALGIDSSIDVFTFDPVANKGDGGINDFLYEKGNQLTVLAFALQNIINDLNTTTETTQDYFKAITEEIEKEYTATETKVNIETEAFVTKVFDNVITAKSVIIDETAKANTTKALASILPVIEVKSSDDLTTGVIRFAVSTLQTDIQAIANGTATAETVTSYTSDVLAYIAEDQNIDADEIAPDISAIDDSATTSEDTAIEINVLLNDSYLTSSPISITAANGTHGTTSLASNIVTYDPDADYNGTDTFTYTITQGDKTSSADVTVTIEAVNDAPSIDIASTIQVQENQTAVTTVSVSDVDEDELTLTLGGTDADSFNLSNDNVLTFKEDPDYETKTSYSITLTLTDGNETVIKDITINITNVNDIAPEFTSEATFSAAENQTAIGTVTATDAEGDDVTFTVTGDELAITSTGVLTFVTEPDFETKASYTATLTATDGTNPTTQDITVNINDLNDAPTIGISSVNSHSENTSLIGSINAIDEDADPLSFSISGGEDRQLFVLSSSGELSFLTAPNYERPTDANSDNIYNVEVTVTDGSLIASKNISLQVNDINDAPTIYDFFPSNFYLYENGSYAETVSGTDCRLSPYINFVTCGNLAVVTIDGDSKNSVRDEDNNPLIYSITGDDAEYINVTQNGFRHGGGAISLKDNADYETKNVYRFTFNVSDGEYTTSKDAQINILNIDEQPVLISPTNITLDENTEKVLSIVAEDPEGKSVSYRLGASNQGNSTRFNITSDGVLTLKEYAQDYEGYPSSVAYVYIEDDGNTRGATQFTVNLNNLNDNIPQITSEATFSADENQTAIGTVVASDADGDGISYSISGSEITIDASSGVIAFVSAPDYETKSTYTATVTASDGVNSSTQDITINILDVDELSTANDCYYVVNDASTGEFRYCWEEAQSTSGSEYSANVVEPLTITFADESIEIPAISYAEKLYVEYGIVLESSEGDWTNDQAYAIYQTLKKIPQNVRNEANDRRVFSKWALTDLQIQDDISFDKDATNIEVTIESSVFENANPRIATVDGKKGIYFSNKLHNALVRYVTNGGNDTSAVNKILVERYGVTTSIDDYVALTGEQATRFQDFQAEELVAIISMFEEMPSGYHKIEGLDYLVRRINGADNPYYPEAPAIAWDGSGYIEFMEKAFNTVSIDYLHRLILHEKAHFLWAKIFDDELKNNWIELGGWYECTEKESGWCTTKQTEFVSAYAHLKNPNEDMAESLSYFIVNPDALKSRSLAKYEFVRDRIMQGNIYISQIQENLTFKVYNLYPDYVFPGKVKKLFVSVDGAPTEDKTVTVEIQLHALDKILEGAAWARMRIFSTADTYFDLYLYPQNGQNLDTTLRGTYTLSKYAKSGFWKTSQLVLSDEVGNLRMEGANDFGWRMFVNNPNEDLDKPLYIANSMTLTKSLTTIENQEVDVITALWDIDEAFPRENQGCYGALNDENPSTYSLQIYSPQTYSGNYEAGKCFLEYIMPSYMPSGTYRLNYIKMIDEAGNESRNYFASPSGVDTGDNFAGDQLDELAKEVVLETSNPDITAPELDLNNISINATPTNSDNPNGETIVKFTFRVKDDISGYKLGYYTFRDPQGLTSGYYHYPERRSEIFPTAEDLDWYEYTSTVILPAGSAPGTWGVVELTLRDRALNFKTYNFTEIISFQTE